MSAPTTSSAVSIAADGTEVGQGKDTARAQPGKGRSSGKREPRHTKAREARVEGYFQTQLRAQALAPRAATPTTINALLDDLREYLPEQDVQAIHRAYDFAEAAHAGQFRRTGHDYITHPLAVANILAAMRMDCQSITAAVMHDVLEDTGISKGALAAEFGAEVAEIVDGVSKLSTIFKSRAEAQAENFQKMAMAMARDLRVILVKLRTGCTTCAPSASCRRTSANA